MIFEILGVDSNDANKVMDHIRENFIGENASSIKTESGIKLADAVEFRCVDSDLILYINRKNLYNTHILLAQLY